MAQILVVGPHPDDQEIGMGGTIAKLAAQGHDVLLLDVTDGSPTPRGDRASRLIEAEAALGCLVPKSGPGRVRRLLLGLTNREVEHTLASRHAVAGVIRAHQANIVFVPHGEDAHPDHRAVTRIVEDARFDAKLTKTTMPIPPGYHEIGPPMYARWLLYYDVSHLRRIEKPSFCIDITGYEQQKLRAVRAYRSQFGPWDDSPGVAADPGKLVSTDFPERMLSNARLWGSLIATAYAEPFFTKEPLGLEGLSGVVGV